MEKEFKFNPGRHMYTLDGKPLMGVTTVLGVIAKPALIGWAAKETARALGWYDKKYDNVEDGETELREGLYALQNIGTLEYYNILEEARNAHVRKKEEGGKKGTDIHAWIEEWIKGNNPVMPKEEGAHKQLDRFIQWAEIEKVEFLESEKRMYSEKYWIGGTCDAVATIDGKKFVVDFKTQAKLWDKTPFLQIAGYRIMLEEMGEKDIQGGLVVLLPKEGGLETHYSYDYDTDREGFLAALKLYKTLK